MTKYVIGVLVFIAALAGLLLYVGDDARLVITSTAEAGLFQFPPLDMSWQSVIVLITLSIIGVLALWTFLGWLWRLPLILKSGSVIRRRDKALDAMEEALIAGAEGDQSKSRKKAEKARDLIASPALGRMVSAQAAEACGDSEEAIEQYRAMLDDEKTEATGRRGLAQQLLATGDLNGAIEHASEAYANNKSARWAYDVLFQAQVSDHRWQGASETLELAASRKHADKDVARRRKAVLMTAGASELDRSGDSSAAMDLAVSASQEAPEFAPAAALAANLLMKSGDVKKAANVLEKAWSSAPHPALALAFRDTLVGENEKSRSKKITSFVKGNADDRESVILTAEESILSGDGVAAWSALSPLMQNGEPSARLCLLAAEAETMLNNPKDAAVWTERAATAPYEANWSDLDPEGDAFTYSDQDWRRLVFSFGENGELIHPRAERGEARRAVAHAEENLGAVSADIQNMPTPRQPDDPGPEKVGNEDDLPNG